MVNLGSGYKESVLFCVRFPFHLALFLCSVSGFGECFGVCEKCFRFPFLIAALLVVVAVVCGM